MYVGRNNDRQQRVLERVLLEDIGERCADDRSEAPLRERPGSVLARAAAAEVIARQQHLNTFCARLVQDEVRPRIALSVIAPVIEKLLVQTRFGSGLEE